MIPYVLLIFELEMVNITYDMAKYFSISHNVENFENVWY